MPYSVPDRKPDKIGLLTQHELMRQKLNKTGLRNYAQMQNRIIQPLGVHNSKKKYIMAHNFDKSIKKLSFFHTLRYQYSTHKENWSILMLYVAVTSFSGGN